MSSVPCPPDCDNPNYHLHTAPSDPAYFLLEDDYTSTPDQMAQQELTIEGEVK